MRTFPFRTTGTINLPKSSLTLILALINFVSTMEGVEALRTNKTRINVTQTYFPNSLYFKNNNASDVARVILCFYFTVLFGQYFDCLAVKPMKKWLNIHAAGITCIKHSDYFLLFSMLQHNNAHTFFF